MADLPDTDGKNLVELLDMLNPVPEPAPVSMVPATQGWIWLGLAILAALVWSGRWGWRRWQANAYRRAALEELDAAGDDPATTAAILRRAALVAYPRRKVVGLLGEEWLAFLEETCPGAHFTGPAGAALLRAPYRPEGPNPELTRIARRWVKSHKAGAAA